MMLRLGNVELAIAALEMAQHCCETESDEVPEHLRAYQKDLARLNLLPRADEVLRALKTKRRNRGGTTWHHVVPDKKREEKTGEERPVAPSGLPGLSENEFSRFVPSK